MVASEMSRTGIAENYIPKANLRKFRALHEVGIRDDPEGGFNGWKN